MVEILGGNLRPFFENMCRLEGVIALIGYENTIKNYGKIEVIQLKDEDFDKIKDMSEEKFIQLAGEDAWWRHAEGSNLGVPYGKFIINHHRVRGWESRNEYGRYKARCNYDSLLDYFCNHIGASQPRNICALATDMAKYNNMTMSELFTKLQPIEVNENV